MVSLYWNIILLLIHAFYYQKQDLQLISFTYKLLFEYFTADDINYESTLDDINSSSQLCDLFIDIPRDVSLALSNHMFGKRPMQ